MKNKEPDMPFPELYEEKKFISSFDPETYLARQAGSALFLCSLYRQWRQEMEKGDIYWYVRIASSLMHLIRLHELQGASDVIASVSAKERRSWYLDRMYEECSRDIGLEIDDNGMRLAIHGVMYLRGLARYRQLVAAGFGHPYTLWIRDAELNARICFDTLEEVYWDHNENLAARMLVSHIARVEGGIVKAIEERK